MAFTGVLGTQPSTLGNIVLGVRSAAGPQPTFLPNPTLQALNLPIPGVPWSRFQPTFPLPNIAPLAPLVPPGVTLPSPFLWNLILPIPGVPWAQFGVPFLFPSIAPVVPPPPVPPPFYSLAIFGVPWLPKFAIPLSLDQPPPVHTEPPVWNPATPGVPLPGVPWAKPLGLQTPIPFPSPPGPPRPPVRQTPKVPLLARVPDIKSEHGQERLRRHTEIISAIVNALMENGQLIQLGAQSWRIAGPTVMPRPPGPGDDLTKGYAVGQSWVDSNAGNVYFCISNAVNAAVWKGPF